MSEARQKLQKFSKGGSEFNASMAKDAPGNIRGAKQEAWRAEQEGIRRTRPISSEVSKLLDQYQIKPPKKFDLLPKVTQLDYIATRILAKSRTTTSHREMRDEGILSISQYERRLHREVYSNYGTLNNIQTVEMQQGVFGRVFPKSKNEYVHGDKARQREYVRKHL